MFIIITYNLKLEKQYLNIKKLCYYSISEKFLKAWPFFFYSEIY